MKLKNNYLYNIHASKTAYSEEWQCISLCNVYEADDKYFFEDLLNIIEGEYLTKWNREYSNMDDLVVKEIGLASEYPEYFL